MLTTTQQNKITVTVGLPVAETLAAINAAYTTRMILLAIGTGLILVLCTLGIRSSLLLPLRRLSRAMRDLEAGSSLAEPARIGTIELTELNKQFFRMARTRVAAEDRLKRSEEILLLAQQVAGLGHWTLDPSTGQRRWSDQACEVLGVDPGDDGLGGDAFFDRIHPDDRETVRAAYRALIERGEAYDIDYRVPLTQGSIQHVHERSRSRLDDAGQMHTLGTVLNITERKLAEAASRAKTAFLANMSHEIRTPMNAILGLTHLLQRSGPDQQQAARLARIDSAGHHLLGIINDILDLSKIESGELVLDDADFHLDSIFDHVTSLIDEQARNKGLQLLVDTSDVPRWLRGDPTRLRQALLNYAFNAVKFTDQGNVALRARKIETRDEAVLVRFEVEDTGIGIDAGQHPQLFADFQQATASTAREYGGTGLGLAITQHLAGLMKGEVGMRSEVGKGSVFWFTAWLHTGREIDSRERNQPSAIDAEQALRNQHRGARILLAEDNEINREVATELLHAAGLEVESCSNGSEALEKVRTGAYALVLMDVQMPIMGGLAATREIRALDGAKRLPILAMTANAFEQDRIACFVAGMNDFISKPVNPEIFFRVLLKWLPQRGAHDHPGCSSPTAESVAAVGAARASVEQGDKSPSLIELGALDTLLRGDTSKLNVLLRMFAAQAQCIGQDIQRACATRSSQELAFNAHKLKSSARQMHAKTLADLCHQMEVAAKQDDWPAIERLEPDLKKALAEISEFIGAI